MTLQMPTPTNQFPLNRLIWSISMKRTCPALGGIGNSYVSVGGQKKVDSPGLDNPWNALFGSLIYPTGEGIYTSHERKRHQEVQAHIERLIEFAPNAFYFIVMDGASAHTTPRLNDFWEQHKGTIERVFQPTYSPHLNLIERLWRFMRGQMTKNQFYGSLEILSKAIVEWLEKLSFAEFCSLMSVDDSELEFV